MYRCGTISFYGGGDEGYVGALFVWSFFGDFVLKGIVAVVGISAIKFDVFVKANVTMY